jgi:hypothetical protein
MADVGTSALPTGSMGNPADAGGAGVLSGAKVVASTTTIGIRGSHLLSADVDVYGQKQ